MVTMPKILMLVENLPVPADPRVWAEATTLQQRGCQVSIICPKGCSHDQESYVCLDNIHIYRYRLPTLKSKFLAYLAEYSVALLMTFLLCLKVWVRSGFDVIHAANPPDVFFIIGLFFKLFGKRFVFDQHDLSPELFQVKFKGRLTLLYRLLLVLQRWSYRTADVVIVTNSSQRRIALERGHCSPDKVFVVRNGPALESMQPITPGPDLKKRRGYLLAYVGVMGAQDGVEYALYALHDLVYKRGRQDVSLVLMGNGEAVPHLQALAHALQLNEHVHFTGWISRADINRYLSVADVGLIPDPQNGLNEYSTMVKAMEYMAMGKAIVAFDLAETRVSAQEAACYARPNLVEDFADKIEVLLDNEELRLSMGVTGCKRIKEQLSWDHTKEPLLRAYEMLFPRTIGMRRLQEIR